MNREQLEAAIRGLLAHYAPGMPTPRQNALVAAILADADAYAAGDSDGVTALRRLVLDAAAAGIPEGTRR